MIDEFGFDVTGTVARDAVFSCDPACGQASG
jgi:hypothetical protein